MLSIIFAFQFHSRAYEPNSSDIISIETQTIPKSTTPAELTIIYI